jgi:hypothetical protein
MNNRPVGSRSSKKQSHPIYMIIIIIVVTKITIDLHENLKSPVYNSKKAKPVPL